MTVTLMFFRANGSEQCSRQFYAPGKFWFGQDEEVAESFDHPEGSVVPFHIGHGIMRDYQVVARDAKTVFLQQA